MIIFISKAHATKTLGMSDIGHTRPGLQMLKYTQNASPSPSNNSARKEKEKKQERLSQHFLCYMQTQ